MPQKRLSCYIIVTLREERLYIPEYSIIFAPQNIQ